MTGKTLCKISGAAESAHLCNFADGHACILQQRPRILQAFFLQKLNGRKFRILLPVPVKRPFAETELPDKLLQTDFIHKVSGEIGGDFADPRMSEREAAAFKLCDAGFKQKPDRQQVKPVGSSRHIQVFQIRENFRNNVLHSASQLEMRRCGASILRFLCR